MSKGNRIVPVRISDDLYQQMLDAIEGRNNKTQEEPFNVSDFIRYCIRVKLNHRLRSNRKGRRSSSRKPAQHERA